MVRVQLRVIEELEARDIEWYRYGCWKNDIGSGELKKKEGTPREFELLF